MTGYSLFNLSNMLDQLGTERVKNLLDPFLCPINKDVEKFFRESSITFAQQNIAPTFLVYASYRQKEVLVGYFTLTNKSLTVDPAVLGSKMRSRVKKFATYNKDIKKYIISSPLIAQLGKNYANDYDKLITGEELLLLACNRAKEAQMIIGGKIVYLECENAPGLLDFYKRNDFVQLGKRELDKDESALMKGRYLIQMLKYL